MKEGIEGGRPGGQMTAKHGRSTRTDGRDNSSIRAIMEGEGSISWKMRKTQQRNVLILYSIYVLATHNCSNPMLFVNRLKVNH